MMYAGMQWKKLPVLVHVEHAVKVTYQKLFMALGHWYVMTYAWHRAEKFPT